MTSNDKPVHREWIDLGSLEESDHQRDSLEPALLARIRAVRAAIHEVDFDSEDHWIDNFRRDANPWRELFIWETMARAYFAFCSGRTLSLPAKREALGLLVMRSSASEGDPLPFDGKNLDTEQLRELLELYQVEAQLPRR